MNDLPGKEITPVKIIGRTKPELVTIGDNQIVPGGRWNNDTMADFVLQEGQKDWVSIGRLAKVGCGSNTIPNKKRVRSRLSQLFMTFRKRGEFLAVDYGGDHNSAMGVKVADIKKLEDRKNVEAKLERMRKRKEMTQQNYEQTMDLLDRMVREATG
jgi:hypothetical protein